MKKIRVGLIGFGLSGKIFHAPLLKALPAFTIDMVSSSREREVHAVLPEARVVTDPQILLQNAELDLVVNCAPNHLHFEYAAQALNAGKHVVVEKPFVVQSTQAVQLLELARRHQKVLSVFQNRRWDADFLSIQKLLRSKTLGPIRQFESRMDRYRPTVRAEKWKEQKREGAGVFYDLGAHLVDQALFLFGKPDRIWADIQAQKKDGVVDDYFQVVFYYDQGGEVHGDGLRVILQSSSFAPGTARFQIFGEQGSYIKCGGDPQEEQLRQGMSPTDPLFGVESERQAGLWLDHATSRSSLLTSERGSYLSYYESLHRAITASGPEPVPASQGLLTTQMMEIAVQSSHGGQVMKLDPRYER